MYPYAIRHKYPHLAPNDVAIWEKFIVAYPNRYRTVDYDFALGSVPLASEIVSTYGGGEMVRIYQKRIDVLAESEGETHIIEVKPNAGAGAIGQLLGYKVLYLNYINPNAKVKCILVTDRLNVDMAMLCEHNGIELVVV